MDATLRENMVIRGLDVYQCFNTIVYNFRVPFILNIFFGGGGGGMSDMTCKAMSAHEKGLFLLWSLGVSWLLGNH